MAKVRARVATADVAAYTPQIATRAREAPAGDDWLHEINYAGYRVGCRVNEGVVSLTGTDGTDWTGRFREICDAALGLGVRQALLDGTVSLLLPDGTTSLEALENASTTRNRRGIVYFAFDLLAAGGESFIHLPLEERKRELLRLVGGPYAKGRIRYSEHVAGRGPEFLNEACRLGVGGILSRRRDSTYTGGRSRAWLEIPCELPAVEKRSRTPDRPMPLGTATRPAATSGASSRVSVADVSISHPERVMFGEPRVSKLDVARFYERIADWILPHLAGRPLTLVRCPAGFGSPCHYMKHTRVWSPPALRRLAIQEKTKVGEYLIADTLPALISLVQMDILEIHTWNTRFERVEQPDRIVFDIDPGIEAGWSEVIAAARAVRRLLQSVDLESFPKTTGGKGLHVVVPLLPRADWRDCLAFSRALAETLERHDPARFTTAFAKAGRERKILIDYLRNNRTNTSVAAFSTRAREGAPVSTPLTWQEITTGAEPPSWNIVTIERRLAALRKDPWKDYWTCRQHLSPNATAALEALE
ncbi:MAG: bifunctional non-ous end joining protein LigD [Acidobacteriota bacterium]